jgi:hypothetical protein
VALKALSKSLKKFVPLHATDNSFLLWRAAFMDEGVKALAEFTEKVTRSFE